MTKSITEKRAIIIDTDPGNDDAVAILLALASPELEVVGITAIAGNVPLALTEKNARKICELAGRPDINVYAGAERPIVRPLVTGEHVHGNDGLYGPDLPEPTMALQEQHAVDFIIETVRKRPDKSITLCPLGALTNIAVALVKAPDIIPKIREIIIMGGGHFQPGNVTPVAEFNIYVDPHAAETVFTSGIPLTVIPLDVTHKAITTRVRMQKFRDKGTYVCEVVADMVSFFERFAKEKYGTDGCPLHDPCVIGYLLRPEIFSGRHINVQIETQSELTMGSTVADYWGATDRPANAMWITQVDADALFDLLVERIGTL